MCVCVCARVRACMCVCVCVYLFIHNHSKSPQVSVCTLKGTDPEYLQEVEQLAEKRDKRVFIAESFRSYEAQCAQEEYEREKSLAEAEFEVSSLVLYCFPESLREKVIIYKTRLIVLAVWPMAIWLW